MAARSSKRNKNSEASKQKAAKQLQEVDQAYPIRAIIGESADQYEVAWEDSWVCKDAVSEEAVKYWNEKQLALIPAASVESSPSSSSRALGHIFDEPVTAPKHEADLEIRESPSVRSQGDQESVHNDSDVLVFTLYDGSQIRVSRSHYTLVGSPAPRQAHAVVNGAPETQDAEQPTFQPRSKGLVVSSTTEGTESDLIQSAYEILTQSDDAAQRPATQLDSSSKDSSGLLSQGTLFLDTLAHQHAQSTTRVLNSIERQTTGTYTFEDSASLSGPPLSLLQSTLEVSQGQSSLGHRDSSSTRNLRPRMLPHSAVPPHMVGNIVVQPASPTLRSDESASTTPSVSLAQPGLADPQTFSSLLAQSDVAGPSHVSSAYNGVHLVGLPMILTQQDQYQSLSESDLGQIAEQIINLGSQETDDDLLEEGERLLERLHAIATHPDLDTYEAMTQYDVQPDHQAEWDSQCSAKFRFLRELFEHAHGRGLHIVIAVDGGQELRLITRFLAGIQIPLASTPPESTAETRVTILDDELLVASIKPADVVIGLNTGWNGDPPLIFGRNNTPAPCLQLVSPYTVEHVELSLPRGLSKESRVKILLENIQNVKQQLTRARDLKGTTHHFAEKLVTHLKSTPSEEWPLAELNKLLLHIDNTTVEHEYSRSNQERKRPLEDAVEHNQLSKRQRTDKDDGTMSDIRSDYEVLRAQLSTAEKRRDDLEQDLLQARLRMSEFEQSTENLFGTTEQLRDELFELQQERNDAVTKLTRWKDKFDAKTDDNSTLRAERASLREQLREANIRLASHVVPERAVLERERQTAQQAVENATKAQNRSINMDKDLTYIRSEYQKARDEAYNLALENTSLLERAQTAEYAAALELSKAKQLSLDKLTELAMRENKKMKAILASREAELNARDEEIARLKDAARGRIGTRASSVPRSPRVGSPMKQMISDGFVSRHGSPAAGEVRDRSKLHPLRNGS